jgi:mRNA interferase RelE/StbE
MVYAVEFATAARRQFRKLPRAVQAIVKPKIDALASDPRPHGVEKMSGEEHAYRVRVGDYRIIYEIPTPF